MTLDEKYDNSGDYNGDVVQHLNVSNTTTDFLTALLSEPCQERSFEEKIFERKKLLKKHLVKRKDADISLTTVPMNRIVVGTAPSPNLWNTQSR